MSNRSEENRELSILKSAVENTNEAFVTIDENHKVLFFNKAAEKIFGYSRDEVIGHDLDVIMTPGCSRDHRQAVERYAKTRVPQPNWPRNGDCCGPKRWGDIYSKHLLFRI